MSRRESDVDIQGNWDKVFISCYRRTVYKGCIDIKNLLKKKMKISVTNPQFDIYYHIKKKRQIFEKLCSWRFASIIVPYVLISLLEYTYHVCHFWR